MRLNISERNGRTYLYIEKGYRNKDGQPRNKNIKTIGYADKYKDVYPDPIAHFMEVVRKMNEEENDKRKSTLSIDMNEELPVGADNRRNLGYAAILKIYYELELDRYLKNKSRHQNFKYNTNSIMTLLVVSRILSPGSKKKAFEEKGRYFERFDFSLEDIYKSLTHFAPLALDIQRHIHERITALYGRDTRTVYYDVTNYYFEIDAEDGLRKRGVSKERRRDPIVQMGLAMDADGIPLHYELFEGNLPDKSTFRSVIGEVKRNYNAGRIVVVADMGIITGDNIYYLVGGEKRKKALNGYVFSYSIRGGDTSFKKYVLDRGGYLGSDGKPVSDDAAFMMKSRRIAREINVTMENGKTVKKTIYEKQVVFWGKKYADKAKAERDIVLKKAGDMVSSPHKYTGAGSYGAAKYVKNFEYDKNTGEVIDTGKKPYLDTDKIMNEEKYDGYYAIVTSELWMPDYEIIDTYRGLWEIEETFKVTKSTIESRPVFVSREDRIDAHFLTCFIALVIIRLILKKTGRLYSCEKIISCLIRISCSLEQENIYLFDYRSVITEAVGEAMGINFNMKRLRLGEIKSIIADTKK